MNTYIQYNSNTMSTVDKPRSSSHSFIAYCYDYSLSRARHSSARSC